MQDIIRVLHSRFMTWELVSQSEKTFEVPSHYRRFATCDASLVT